MNDDEIRYQILEILYKEAKENPEGWQGRSFGLTPKEIMNKLQVPEKDFYFNMDYLDKKGLIKIKKVASGWMDAKITAYGTDVYEHKDKYKDTLPFIQTNIQNISANVIGNVTQAVDSTVIFDQRLSDAFRQARIITENQNITQEQKEETNKRLDSLEEGIKSGEPDVGKIQRLWKWLKENANWVVPAIIQVVSEYWKKVLG